MSSPEALTVWLRVKGYADFMRKMVTAGTKTEDLGKKARKTGHHFNYATQRMNAFTKGLGVMHRISYLGAVGITAAVGGAVMAYVDFNQQMANLRAVTGSTDSEMKGLHDTILSLGASTKFSNTEIAATATTLAKAGYSLIEVQQLLPGVASFAAAAQIDLADAVGLVTDQVTVFGYEAKEAGGVSDMLTAALNATKLEAGDLGESLKYIGPIAAQAGLSLEDTLSVVGLLAQQGIKGSQAGTALRMGLQRLAREPKAVAEAFEELGISQESFLDASGNLRPFNEIIDVMKRATQDMTGFQKTEVFSKIFGAEASTAWVALTADVGATGKSYEELFKIIKESDAANLATKQAEEMTDTVGGAFERLRGQWETFWIVTLEPFEEDIKDLFEFIEKWLDFFMRDTDYVLKKVIPHWEVLKEAIQDLWDVLYYSLWPVLQDLEPLITFFGGTVLFVIATGLDQMAENADITRVSFAFLIGLFAAWKAMQLVKFINRLRIALVLLFGVMRRHPVIALLFVLTAVATALYELYKNDEDFHKAVDEWGNKLWDFRDNVKSWYDDFVGIFTGEGPWYDWLGDQIRLMTNQAILQLNLYVDEINKLLPERFHVGHLDYVDWGIESMEERFKDPFFGTGGILDQYLASKMPGLGSLEGLGPGLMTDEEWRKKYGLPPGGGIPGAGGPGSFYAPKPEDLPGKQYSLPPLDASSDQDAVLPGLNRNAAGSLASQQLFVTTQVFLDKKKIAEAIGAEFERRDARK